MTRTFTPHDRCTEDDGPCTGCRHCQDADTEPEPEPCPLDCDDTDNPASPDNCSWWKEHGYCYEEGSKR